ncbi:hypothetical protein KP79_PYT22574 [Mizuhopecten yessoensis]|uniref:Uncharacterized protein n=2 Tax=Mizuhopecten yessoensis TaxID=6573 RepID=A0A210QGT8_MIZYE|nr:hypothetical protein KP79_PYT22574 [Mizuhopecten yessoensis]
MGCNIGVMNQKVPNLGGTLGPFVRYNGNTSFLTCAHVLFDVAQQGTVDFTYDGSNRIDVVQPALDTSMASGAACGFIQRAIFNPRMHPSIDMAVVTISDESRLPDKGRFANDHSSRYKKAGFKHLPEYNDGSRVLDFQESGTSNMVVQFGSETHLSKGFLKEDGIQVRPLTTVLGLPQSKDIFRMSGQYEVEGLRSMPNLFMPGDSGAAVFMLNGTSLHCIGMAIGSTSTGNAVVTPIAALLDAVRANADIDLSVFP